MPGLVPAAVAVGLSLAAVVHCQTTNPNDTLGIGNGFTEFTAGGISGSLVKDSQTLASLRSESNFDFLPLDFLPNLAFDGAHHFGDITFRYRTAGNGSWTSVDSSSQRNPVAPIDELPSDAVAGADLAATLPHGIPVKVTREWLAGAGNGGLTVRFNLTNTAKQTVELGALGIPVVINNIFNTRTAEDTQANCSLADPYIGLDAGYVRVSPIKGLGQALVVTPLGKTPFEAWRLLPEPQGNYWYQTQTYEGNYEWQIHTLAYAESEWNATEPWNTPTAKSLEPGETYSVGLKLSLANSIQTIDDAVVAAGVPVAVGIPGYVIPADLTAQLFLFNSSAVKSIDSFGAFEIKEHPSSLTAYSITPTGTSWGRSKIAIQYEDGKTQAIHYYITKSAPQTAADLGNFLTTAAHFTNRSDPFGRAPSIMGYDSEAEAIVLQDERVWIAGLSDEGGTGAYVAAATKQFFQPVEREVAVLDDFVHDTIVGTIQPADSFGVRASVFYYQPNETDYPYDPNRDWTSWASWDRERAYTIRRAYNYVHPVVAYWSMYRVARNYPDVETRSNWTWYLDQAYNTIQFCLADGAPECDYGLTGLMGETVFAELLEDLKRENMSEKVTALEETMKFRAEFWESLTVPFGSEMAWDSTGQEGVYYWTDYFGLENTALKAINSIVAYMPTVAHWGWNGNARRYWDFNYGAKLTGTERQIHHYGSGLNSLPMLHYYERNTSDFNAIRVGFAGNLAPLTNINQEGCPSAAFHSFPEHLKWDAYTGDYGLGFLGLGLGQTTYIVNQEPYGDLVFGGNIVESTANKIVAEPRDAVRRRVFVASLNLKVILSAGAIETVTYDREGGTLRLDVVPAATESGLKATAAVVWLKQLGSGNSSFIVTGAPQSRGGFFVDLSNGSASFEVSKA